MADFSVKLNGLDELNKKLQGLSYDMARKGGRFALRKAAGVIVKRAQTNAQAFDDPETGRSIAKNVISKWNGRLNKTTGDLGFRIGVQGGSRISKKGNPDEGANGPTPHWRFVEFGSEHNTPKPFLRAAGSEAAQAATDEFIRQYGPALDRALLRAGK